MRKLALIIAAIFFVSGVAAQPVPVQEENLDQYRSEINSYSDEVPGLLASIIEDQTINVRFDLNGTEQTVGIDMNGTEVNEIRMEGYEDATLEVNTSQQQITELTESERPLELLNRKIEEGEIEYSTEGTLNSVVFFLAEKLLKLSSLI